MKHSLSFSSISTFLLCCILIVTSCKKASVDDATSNNKPPVANAGVDQIITFPNNVVTLDGSGSTDPDNNITGYVWAKISGPSTFNIVNANTVQTQVTTLTQGVYQFELKVIDNGGLSAKDTVQILVNPFVINSCNANRPIINAKLVPFGTLSQPRGGVAIGATKNKIVFAGGYAYNNLSNTYNITSSVDIYNTGTQNWSTAQLTVPRYDVAITTLGNKIFFAGGVEQGPWDYDIINSNVDIYDAEVNSWSVTNLSNGRQELAAASAGNKVLFAGGNWLNLFTDKIDIYDGSNNLMSVTSSRLSTARTNLSGVSSGNKIYFAGGYTQQYPFTPSDNIDIYDAISASWSTSKLSEPKDGHAAIAVNNKIYWAGGTTFRDQNNNPHISSVVEIRDITTQTSTFACLFQPNSDFAAVVKDNKMVFFTGNGAVKNKFDIYDIATNIWSIGVLPQNIEGAAIISVNNIIYVAGGYVNGVLSNQVRLLEW
ncbi:MAG: hypothetical protein H0W75_00860 [Chitinophagaceae bacterium]|nr:hypothetical protein [Chitinophagaceae bacterium]